MRNINKIKHFEPRTETSPAVPLGELVSTQTKDRIFIGVPCLESDGTRKISKLSHRRF